MSEIKSFEISNGDLSLTALNLGAIITKIMVPDHSGTSKNMVLNYSNLEQYVHDPYYLGCIAGRFANRISKGHFELDGQPFTLSKNNGSNHLHGGKKGFNSALWKAEKISANKLAFYHTSPHMDEGYPGELIIKATYELTDKKELVICYEAKTDRKTVINLTNHSYFNLSGVDHSTVFDHDIKIYSDTIIEINDCMIPTGRLIKVEKTPFNFLIKKNIGLALNDHKLRLAGTKGFDHCYVFEDKILKLMAEMSCQHSGIKMSVHSTEPGIQFYTGNHLNKPFQQHSGVCLETQHFPDSPNQRTFPSTVLKADSIFESKTVYQFELLNS